MQWVATTGYALEGVLSREIKELGFQVLDTQTSRVAFEGDWEEAASACLWLRTAGHVRMVAGTFSADSFEALFEGTRGIRWDQWLPRNAAFPVTARAINAQLMSVPDIQSIVKRAVVEGLKRRYPQTWFPEDGPVFPIEAHIWKDKVTLSIDLCGDPLHKRGYRALNGPAALRETLAASMVRLSRWSAQRPFWDPCCGTGTLPVEAAMIGRKLAPGANRSFLAEAWNAMPPVAWRKAREHARDAAEPQRKLEIFASDRDPEALRMARYHAKAANVTDTIRFEQKEVASVRVSQPYGHFIVNPPYGERLEDKQNAEAIIRALGEMHKRAESWSCHVISPHPAFERTFGVKATYRPALYNGNLPCHYFQFMGPRPPRKQDDGAEPED